MFESLVTNVLTSILGNYIKPSCFSTDKINVGVWSGYVVLHSLELKEETFQTHTVQLRRGVLGAMEIKIPWNRLQSDSVVVTIDDVYLVLESTGEFQYPDDHEQQEELLKKQLVEQLYSKLKSRTFQQPQQQDDSFATRLRNKIVDNLEFHVRNIHIRIEDHVTGDHSIALGLTVESLHAQSADSQWQSTFVDSSVNKEPVIYKNIELNHLSIYLNPHSNLTGGSSKLNYSSSSIEDFVHSMGYSIPKRYEGSLSNSSIFSAKSDVHHYILKPIDASARLSLRRDPCNFSIPTFQVDVSVGDIALQLEDEQYRDILYLMSGLSLSEAKVKYSNIRPRIPVKSSPRTWWLYAYQVVLEKVRYRRKQWSWSYIKQRRDDRKMYIKLWKRVETSQRSDSSELGELRLHCDNSNMDTSSSSSSSSSTSLSIVDDQCLKDIEDRRSVDDIVFFRFLADSDTNKLAFHDSSNPNEANIEVTESETTGHSDSSGISNTNSSFWDSILGSVLKMSPMSISANASVHDLNKQSLPDIEIKELYSLLGYGSMENGGVEPNDQVKCDDAITSKISFTLSQGSVSLASTSITSGAKNSKIFDGFGNSSSPYVFIRCVFQKLQLAVTSKESSMKLDMSLQSIEVFNECAENSTFSRLVAPKDNLDIRRANRQSSFNLKNNNTDNTNSSQQSGPTSANGSNMKYVFLLSYETNPGHDIESTQADSSLTLHMEPLEIVYSPTAYCWTCLSKFMSTPKSLGLWAEMEIAALNEFVSSKARTEAKLEYIMANRIALSVDLRIQAPVIIIPENDSDYDCARLIVDLGHVNLITERLSQLEILEEERRGSPKMSHATLKSSGRVQSKGQTSFKDTNSFLNDLYSSGRAHSEYDLDSWKEDFYDKYSLSLSKMQVILSPGGDAEAWRSPMLVSNQNMQLIEHFNINISIMSSIIPLDATLYRLYIYCDLPALHLRLSTEKYFRLKRFVDKFSLSESHQSECLDKVSSKSDREAALNILASSSASSIFSPGISSSMNLNSSLADWIAVDLKPSVTTTTQEIPDAGLLELTLENVEKQQDILLSTVTDLNSNSVSTPPGSVTLPTRRPSFDRRDSVESDDTWFSVPGHISSLSTGATNLVVSAELKRQIESKQQEIARRQDCLAKLKKEDQEHLANDVHAMKRLSHLKEEILQLSTELLKLKEQANLENINYNSKENVRHTWTGGDSFETFSKKTKLPQSSANRKLLVCTFTLPMVTIQFQKKANSFGGVMSDMSEGNSFLDQGFLVLRLEGIHLKVKQNTFHSETSCSLGHLELEDCMNIPGEESNYLVFSCPFIEAPYSPSFPSHNYQRKRDYYRSNSNNLRRSSSGMGYPFVSNISSSRRSKKKNHRHSPTAEESTDLAKFSIKIYSPGSCPVNGNRIEIDVAFNALHAQLGHSTLSSLFDLFYNSSSSSSDVGNTHPHSDNTLGSNCDTHQIPILELPPATSSEYFSAKGSTLTSSLTASVQADLDRARSSLFGLSNGKKQDPNADSTLLNPVAINVKIKSLSICFQNAVEENLASIAFLRSSMEMTIQPCVSVSDSKVSLHGELGDLRLLDLQPVLSNPHQGPTNTPHSQDAPVFKEVFGLRRQYHTDSMMQFEATRQNEVNAISISMKSMDVVISSSFYSQFYNGFLSTTLSLVQKYSRKYNGDLGQPKIVLDEEAWLTPSTKPQIAPVSNSPYFDAVDQNSSIKNLVPHEIDFQSFDSGDVSDCRCIVELHVKLINPHIVLPLNYGGEDTEIVIDLGCIAIAVQEEQYEGENSMWRGTECQVEVSSMSIYSAAEEHSLKLLDDLNIEMVLLSPVKNSSTLSSLPSSDNKKSPLLILEDRCINFGRYIFINISPVQLNVSEVNAALVCGVYCYTVEPLEKLFDSFSRNQNTSQWDGKKSLESLVIACKLTLKLAEISLNFFTTASMEGINFLGAKVVPTDPVLSAKKTPRSNDQFRNNSGDFPIMHTGSNHLKEELALLEPVLRLVLKDVQFRLTFENQEAEVVLTIQSFRLSDTSTHRQNRYCTVIGPILSKKDFEDKTVDYGDYNEPQIDIKYSSSFIKCNENNYSKRMRKISITISSMRFLMLPRILLMTQFALLSIYDSAVLVLIRSRQKGIRSDNDLLEPDKSLESIDVNGLQERRRKSSTASVYFPCLSEDDEALSQSSRSSSLDFGVFSPHNPSPIDQLQQKVKRTPPKIRSTCDKGESVTMQGEGKDSVQLDSCWEIAVALSNPELWLIENAYKTDADGRGIGLSGMLNVKVSLPSWELCEGAIQRQQHGNKLEAAATRDIKNEVKSENDQQEHHPNELLCLVEVSIREIQLYVRDEQGYDQKHQASTGAQIWTILEPFEVHMIHHAYLIDDPKSFEKHHDKNWNTQGYTENINKGKVNDLLPSGVSSIFHDTCMTFTKVVAQISYRDFPMCLNIANDMNIWLKLFEEKFFAPKQDELNLDNLSGSSISVAGAFGSNNNSKSPIISSNIPHMFILNCQIDGLTFLLINNIFGQESPVVQVNLKAFDIDACLCDTTLSAAMEVNCEAFYHNLRLVVLEPLVEPWVFRVEVNSNKSTTQLDNLSHIPYRLSVNSDQALNVNISQAFLESIATASKAWDWAQSGGGLTTMRNMLSTYWIRNETGMKLKLWGKNFEMQTIPASDEKPLFFGSTDCNCPSLMFAVEELETYWEATEPLRMNAATGIQMYKLQDKTLKHQGIKSCNCIVEVIIQNGCKFILIRSTVMLENNTGKELEIQYELPVWDSHINEFSKKGKTLNREPWHQKVRPNGITYAPLHFIVMDGVGSFRVRPSINKSDGEKSFCFEKFTINESSLEEERKLQLNVIRFRQHLANQPFVSFVVNYQHSFSAIPISLHSDNSSSGVTTNPLRTHFLHKVSFCAPLVIENLTAKPLDWCVCNSTRLQSEKVGGNSKKVEENTFPGRNNIQNGNVVDTDCQQVGRRGTISVGTSLSWHYSDWETPLNFQIRTKHFEWSEPFAILPSGSNLFDSNAVGEMITSHLASEPDLGSNHMGLFKIAMKDSENRTMFVHGELKVEKGGTQRLIFYVPYWILNRTSLSLQFEHDRRIIGNEYLQSILAGQDCHLSESTVSSRHVESDNRTKFLSLLKKSKKPESLVRDRRRKQTRSRTHRLLPNVPPIKGLVELIPRYNENDLSSLGDDDVESTLIQSSYTNAALEEGSIRIRVAGLSSMNMSNPQVKQNVSCWSTKPINLDMAGTTEVVTIRESTDRMDRLFNIGVSINIGKERFSRTKVITLSPRFILINTLENIGLDIRQNGPLSTSSCFRSSTETAISLAAASTGYTAPSNFIEADSDMSSNTLPIDVLQLPPSTARALHWPHFMRQHLIHVRFASQGWQWSGGFPLDEIMHSSDFVLRMRHDHPSTIHNMHNSSQQPVEIFPRQADYYFLRVSIKNDGASVLIYFKPETPELSPFRIENYSFETLQFNQVGVISIQEILYPHEICTYAWDEPLKEKKIQFRVSPYSLEGETSTSNRSFISIGEFALDEIKKFPSVLNGALNVEVVADGPTRVLRFLDARVSSSFLLDKDKTSISMSNEPNSIFEVRVNLRGVGISIVDSLPRELLYMSIYGIEFQLNKISKIEGQQDTNKSKRGSHAEEMILSIADIQIDNQLPSTPFPVLLYFTKRRNAVSKSNEKKSLTNNERLHELLNRNSVFSIYMLRNNEYHEVDFIQCFSIMTLPMSIHIDWVLLSQLFTFAVASESLGSHHHPALLKNGNQASSALELENCEKTYYQTLQLGIPKINKKYYQLQPHVNTYSYFTSPKSPHKTYKNGSIFMIKEEESPTRASFYSGVEAEENENCQDGKRIYVEELQIFPIAAMVSFTSGVSEKTLYGRDFHTTSVSNTSNDGASSSLTPLRHVFRAIGTTLTKVENAPLRLNSLVVAHSFLSLGVLQSEIFSHYQTQALKQAYKILGSADFLGNPMGVLRNMSTGIWDFFNEPILGLIKRSPKAFGMGLTRGTLSLLYNSLFSLLDFTARISGSITLGLTDATTKLDRYTGYGPANSFLENLFQGLTGVVISPVYGLENEGFVGICSGILAGVFGLILKPLTGISLVTSKTLSALRQAVMIRNNSYFINNKFATSSFSSMLLARIRPPRHFELPMRVLTVYSYMDAVGNEILSRVRFGRYRSDGYLGHVDLRNQYVLLVTKKRVLYLNTSQTHAYRVEWEVLADDLMLVKVIPSSETMNNRTGSNSREAVDKSSFSSHPVVFYSMPEINGIRTTASTSHKGFWSWRLVHNKIDLLDELKVDFILSMLQRQERTVNTKLHSSSEFI